MVKPWYSPSEIRLRPEHVRWLLENLLLLKDGYWPPNPKDTGYTDNPQAKRNYRGAYFETPAGWAAEVEVRLNKCGKDGLLCRQCLAEGWDEQTLADLMGTHVYRIERRVTRVVHYCSGWKRRTITYTEFVQRRKLTANVQFADYGKI